MRIASLLSGRRARAAGVVALAVGLASCSSGGGPHGPVVQVTMKAVPFIGSQVSSGALAQLQAILEHRLSAAHVPDAKLSISGDLVTITAPAAYSDVVQAMGDTALLRFRRVLEVGSWAPVPVASASPAAFVRSTAGSGPLPGSESPALSAIEPSFASWDCSRHPNPTNGDDNPADYVIACAADKSQKYLLAPAEVEGTQVSSASAGLSSAGTAWQVNLQFDGSGSSAWFDLTRKAYDATHSGDSGFGTCMPRTGCNAVAIVLDGIVQSAPSIQSSGGIPGGQAQITGNFTEQEAVTLADQIKYGALPVKLEVTDSTTSTG